MNISAYVSLHVVVATHPVVLHIVAVTNPEFGLLNVDGIIVCEYEVDNFKDNYQGLDLIKARNYGYKNVNVYRRNS